MTVKYEVFQEAKIDNLVSVGWKLMAGLWYHPDPFHNKVYVSLEEAYERYLKDKKHE